MYKKMTVSSKKSSWIYLEGDKIFIIVVPRLRRESRRTRWREEKKVRNSEILRGEERRATEAPALLVVNRLSAPCSASYTCSSHPQQSLQVSGLSCLHKTCIQIHSVKVSLSQTLLLLFRLLPSHDRDEIFIVFLVLPSNTFLSKCVQHFGLTKRVFCCWKNKQNKIAYMQNVI